MGDTEMKGKTIYRPHIFIEGFEYMRTLGVGGFASTHLFRDIKGQYGEFIAVKVPHDKEREEALIRGDIFSLPALRNCPYIAKILDVRCIKGRYVLLMEYVDGPLLRDLLGKTGSVAKLPIEKALKYAIHVAKGLDTAHLQQMVHRDIKPENIIINQSNDTAKILDFGIASLMGRKGHFKTSLRRYTAFYSPGEISRPRLEDTRHFTRPARYFFTEKGINE
jgi:serine/threonine-protein kinase